LATALTLAFAFILALAVAFGVASTEPAPGAASVQASVAAGSAAASAASSTSSATQMLGKLAKVEVNQRASSAELEPLKNFSWNVVSKITGIPNFFFCDSGMSKKSQSHEKKKFGIPIHCETPIQGKFLDCEQWQFSVKCPLQPIFDPQKRVSRKFAASQEKQVKTKEQIRI
jgi:hypothetical protein